MNLHIPEYVPAQRTCRRLNATLAAMSRINLVIFTERRGCGRPASGRYERGRNAAERCARNCRREPGLEK